MFFLGKYILWSKASACMQRVTPYLLLICYITRNNKNHVKSQYCPTLFILSFQMFADMIYKHGFVHCDPHAGNILVRKREDGIDEVVLLDHGLYTVSSKLVNS